MNDQTLMLHPSLARQRLVIRHTKLSISVTNDEETGVRTDGMRVSLRWVIACRGAIICIISVNPRMLNPEQCR